VVLSSLSYHNLNVQHQQNHRAIWGASLLVFTWCSVRISTRTPAILIEGFGDFPQYLQANADMSIRPQWPHFNPFKSIITHPTIWCSIVWLLTASWNNSLPSNNTISACWIKFLPS
jgi:hypothetical protein